MNAIDGAPQWRYPGGYQWFDADTALPQRSGAEMAPTARATNQPDFVLTTGLSAGTYDFESYSPRPNLFLLFADTPDTKEGIKGFADKYGLLGLNGPDGAVMLPVGPSYGSSGTRALGTGELFSAWRREVREMRQAVSLWSALREAQSGNLTRLSGHVHWSRDNLVYYDNQPDCPLPVEAQLLGIASHRKRIPESHKDGFRTVAVIASEKLNPDWFRLFRYGDCLMPAKYYLQKLVNAQLKARVSPQLLWNMRGNRPDNLALFFVAQNLLGLMWLQLAQAINGNRGYRQCSACRTWMLISHEGTGSRSSRFTCSNACRMKVYYGRMIEARRLYQLGLPVREIARRLDAAQEKVHGWIKQRGRQASSGSPRKKGRTL